MEKSWDETEISLPQLLEAREQRADFQQILLRGYGLPLVSFTVNLPGKVKRSARARIVFDAGVRAVREELAGTLAYYKLLDKITGYEGYFCAEWDAAALKQAMCRIESTHPLGRLMDLDVLSPDGKHWSRTDLNKPPRKCLVCARDAVICARSRAHSAAELNQAIEKMLIRWEEET